MLKRSYFEEQLARLLIEQVELTDDTKTVKEPPMIIDKKKGGESE